MSNAKFTKGPWVVFESSNMGPLLERTDADGDTWKQQVGGVSDTNLIAAAPELYDAIEGLLACISETRGESSYAAVQDAFKALAKARGEP